MSKKLTWSFDPTHSQVIFKVKHLVFSSIMGRFNSFNVEMKNDSQDFTNASLAFSAEVSSVDTNNKDRDNHLQSADFFNVEEFPSIRFVSTAIKATEQDKYQVIGDLSILGKTISTVFEAKVSPIVIDPWGNEKVAISLNSKVNRNDFGLSFNATLEKGGFLIGEQVELNAEVQFVRTEA